MLEVEHSARHAQESLVKGTSETHRNDDGAARSRSSNGSSVMPKQTRVLLVITRLTIGGDTNVVLDIARHLHNHPDFSVILAVGSVNQGEADLTHLAYEQGIPTEVIPHLVNSISPFANLRAIGELRRLMTRHRFDVVHTHSSVAGVIGRIAARTARVPVVVHHVHGWGIRTGMPLPTRLLYLGLERLCSTFTDRLIAVSKATIQKGIDHRICREDKFALIYNGIPLERFRQPVDEQRVRAELGLDKHSKLVGMIGRLDEQKNPLDAIRAASLVIEQYPHVQFVIVGEGSLRGECEKLIDDLDLQSRVFLLGFRDDVHRIMAVLSVTMLSSLWEGLPVVFQEAMSAGKPIVANDVDGASDVIVNGETGFLVTPHDPGEMATRLLYLLRNEELCQQMGLTSRERSERFSSRRMVENIEALYRQCCSATGR